MAVAMMPASIGPVATPAVGNLTAQAKKLAMDDLDYCSSRLGCDCLSFWQ